MIEVVVTVLWIAYGCFSAYQACDVEGEHKVWTYILFSIFAPVIFTIRIFIGIFSDKVWET